MTIKPAVYKKKVRDGLTKSVEKISTHGTAQRLLNPPSDQMTKARREIAECFAANSRSIELSLELWMIGVGDPEACWNGYIVCTEQRPS
jgi:hypothetical protein